jgi:acyl-CoA synthetase (AMP-forming)/AMP-acid ligase II
MTAAAENYVLRALEKFTQYGEVEAVVQGDARVTYTEVRDTTLALAAALRDNGIRPGAGVAMLTRNSVQAPSLQLALHLLGCRTLWIAAYEPPRIQAEFFEFAQAEALIYSRGSANREKLAAELVGRDPSLRVLTLGEGDGPGTDLLARLPAQPPALDPAEIGADPESLFYSGGTTGRSKLVRHGQRFYEMMLAIAEYYLSIDEPAMRFLTTSGFTHTSGQMPAFLTLFEGGTLFQNVGFDPASFLATIERERIDSTFLTPALLYTVLDSPAIGTADTSSLRYLNIGGAAASPARLTQAIKRFGPVLRIVYGSSEVPLITDYPFLDHDPDLPGRLSSCGLPFLETQLEIRDENGTVLPAGETGVVWVAGPLLMTSYWQRPDLTAETMAGDWLCTGDVGYLDQDGYLFLVDRITDMIVSFSAATNIYARPIEDALSAHPEVAAAAVIGVPDEAYGEAVSAYVVLTPEASVTADDLRSLVHDELDDAYVPRDIEFVGELPMTSQFKVDKKELRRRAADGA